MNVVQAVFDLIEKALNALLKEVLVPLGEAIEKHLPGMGSHYKKSRVCCTWII